MWLPSLVSSTPDTYLLASMVLLAPFGLATAWLLGGMVGGRALRWSASPMLLLYAFQNWDLAVVAASVAGSGAGGGAGRCPRPPSSVSERR